MLISKDICFISFMTTSHTAHTVAHCLPVSQKCNFQWRNHSISVGGDNQNERERKKQNETYTSAPASAVIRIILVYVAHHVRQPQYCFWNVSYAAPPVTYTILWFTFTNFVHSSCRICVWVMTIKQERGSQRLKGDSVLVCVPNC